MTPQKLLAKLNTIVYI